MRRIWSTRSMCWSSTITTPERKPVPGLGRNHVRLKLVLAHGRKGRFFRALERSDELATAKVLRAASVVLEVKNQGVLILAGFFQGIDDGFFFRAGLYLF